MESTELDKEIHAAVVAHDAWSMKLATAINLGQGETHPDDISCDNKCAFGKWLYGLDVDTVTTQGKPYQVTRRLHAELHQCAGEVARLAIEDRKGKAYSLMDGEYARRSSILLRALTKWRHELSIL